MVSYQCHWLKQTTGFALWTYKPLFEPKHLWKPQAPILNENFIQWLAGFLLQKNFVTALDGGMIPDAAYGEMVDAIGFEFVEMSMPRPDDDEILEEDEEDYD